MSLLRWEEMSPAEKLAVKEISEASLIGFIRVFFQLVQGQKFNRNWHHGYECYLLEKVYRGEIARLILNCPPGSTKTELVSIHWPAWCIIQCIKEERPSRWLPISYSSDLVVENATRVKEIIDSEPFQELWPLAPDPTTNSKSNWKYTDENGKQHRLYGTSLGGQVTGRRAGFMDDEFTGALILDDPLPPKAEGFGRIIDKSNKSLNRVVRSRLAHDGVPIAMVQQRIAKNDSTAFLLSDKAPDDYELFKIPALIDQEYVDSLPDGVREECIKDTGFVGKKTSYWPAKEPTETLLKLENADPYLFNSQYQQAPDDAFLEGVIFRKEIEALVADGRLIRIPVEKALPVFSYWDIGYNDDMAIWLMQPFRQELRMIASFSGRLEGIEHYINWLHDFRDTYGIRYAKHFGPHDLAVHDVMTGKSRIDTAREMGLEFELVERPKLKGDSLNAMRQMFPRLVIDPERCEGGWDAIKKYRREWDPENEIFKTKIVHDQYSNYADALQQLGLSWDDAFANVGKPTKNSSRRRGWKTI